MKYTECNCDMPLEVYCDWLQDQGWIIDLEELEFFPLQHGYTCGPSILVGNGRSEDFSDNNLPIDRTFYDNADWLQNLEKDCGSAIDEDRLSFYTDMWYTRVEI